jgi:small subunit ribosomal protein S1
MSESFAALFEESLKRSEMRTGEVITAEVIRVEHNHVVVNAGLKSEAYVPIEEFKNDQGEIEVQAGDFVSVAIGSVENGDGDTILAVTLPNVWHHGCPLRRLLSLANL